MRKQGNEFAVQRRGLILYSKGCYRLFMKVTWIQVSVAHENDKMAKLDLEKMARV